MSQHRKLAYSLKMENIKAEIVKLPKIFDPRGSLTVVEEKKNIPFTIKSILWRYGLTLDKNIKGKTSHGNQKLFVALGGSFCITVEEGKIVKKFMLNHPYQGLLIHPNSCYYLHDFSNGAVCLEISSE